jgi:protein TonB
LKLVSLLGVLCAFLLHAGFLLFGGLLFAEPKKDHGTTQQVELLASVDEAKEPEKPEPTPEETATDELQSEEEAPPDAAEMIRNIELSEAARAPALDTASLSSIEAALSGLTGSGGDFAQSVDFASGGRIGGSGKGGITDSTLSEVFTMAEIDQKPRAIFQAAPPYPADLRGKKVEGVVTVIFTVSADGKVSDPRVEKSSHPSFDKPALDAVRKWKFEPGVRAGQRVPCRMRVPIRFQPS